MKSDSKFSILLIQCCAGMEKCQERIVSGFGLQHSFFSRSKSEEVWLKRVWICTEHRGDIAFGHGRREFRLHLFEIFCYFGRHESDLKKDLESCAWNAGKWYGDERLLSGWGEAVLWDLVQGHLLAWVGWSGCIMDFIWSGSGWAERRGWYWECCLGLSDKERRKSNVYIVRENCEDGCFHEGYL